jgi:hypothetical protein
VYVAKLAPVPLDKSTAAVILVALFLFFCSIMALVFRALVPRWETLREFARTRMFPLLWPIYAAMRLIDALAWPSEKADDLLSSLAKWLAYYRAVRALAAFGAWWAIWASGWKYWPEVLNYGFLTPLYFPLVFVGVYWPLAALLARAPHLRSREKIYSQFKIAILVFGACMWAAFVSAIPLPFEAPGREPLPLQGNPWQQWILGAFVFPMLFLMCCFVVSAALLPLSIFWPRVAPTPGPKYGDAKLADERALTAQGVVDER